MAVRTNYWWLWRERIPVVYQWTINSWAEWTGDTGSWDAYREASWVVPGEKEILSTVRFELTRAGLEDVEYLAMLSHLTDVAMKQGLTDLAKEGRAAHRLVEQIAWSPSGGRRRSCTRRTKAGSTRRGGGSASRLSDSTA